MKDPRREIRKLLGNLESQKEQDRALERDRAIERNRVVYRFLEIKKNVLLPALRELMLDLEKQGHLTRLTERTRDRVRLDVQLHAQTVKRGAIEFALHGSDAGKLQVGYLWGWDQAQETYGLDRLTSEFVAERLLFWLRRLAEAPAVKART